MTEYSFTNVWGQSWALYKKSWMILTVSVVVYFAANLPTWGLSTVQNVLKIVQEKNPDSVDFEMVTQKFNAGMGFFIAVYSLVVLIPLYAGMLWMGLRAARGQTPEIRDILRGFRRFPSVLGTVLLTYVIVLVPIALAVAVGGAIAFWGVGIETFEDGIDLSDFDNYSKAALAGGAAWALVCIVVAYWIVIRLSLAMFVVIDESLGARGPLQSIELSWRITRQRALSLLGLFITIGLMLIATYLCCCLPVIFVGCPLALVMGGLAYNMLLGRDGFINQSATPFANQPTDAAS